MKDITNITGKTYRTFGSEIAFLSRTMTRSTWIPTCPSSITCNAVQFKLTYFNKHLWSYDLVQHSCRNLFLCMLCFNMISWLGKIIIHISHLTPVIRKSLKEKENGCRVWCYFPYQWYLETFNMLKTFHEYFQNLVLNQRNGKFIIDSSLGSNENGFIQLKLKTWTWQFSSFLLWIEISFC